MLAGEGWHGGVVGIVASRLAEPAGRPVMLVALDGDRGRGSGRSVPGFDLLAALHGSAERLSRFGGHAGAAGLELDAADVPAFAEAFARSVAEVAAEVPLQHVERVDAIVDVADIDLALAEEIARARPVRRAATRRRACWCATRRSSIPRRWGKGVTCASRSPRPAPAPGRRVRQPRSLPVAEGEPATATFTLELNEWRGAVEPRLVLRRASRAAAPYARAAA